MRINGLLSWYNGKIVVGVIFMCGRYAVFTEYEYDEIKSIIDEVSENTKPRKILLMVRCFLPILRRLFTGRRIKVSWLL